MKIIGRSLKEIKKIIAACSGLYLEAVSSNQEVTRSTVHLKLEAINRSETVMQLISVTTLPEQKTQYLTPR
jgi:hypothetical protein